MGGSHDITTLEGALRGLSPELQRVARDLLVYKSLFEGAWFESLGQVSPGPEADAMRMIQAETIEEGERTLAVLREWDLLRTPVDEIAALLRPRMLADLLHVKESTTEAFLLTGMRAPTEALRREFLRLADMDRQHADALRGLLGKKRVLGTDLHRHAARREGASAGAYEGRDGAGSLRARVESALEDLREDGQEPAGMILSAVALRHLRDEKAPFKPDGSVYGLPVEVDLGWRGECFSVVTKERVTLAEMLSADVARSG